MLRRLDLKSSWRSLGAGFWPSDVPAGCRTVVYGHNGSGKSTLSELLLGLAEGSSPATVAWEDESGRSTLVKLNEAGPVRPMSVFTRRWVEANLSAFLDGASASAIVTLGKEAIDAREEEARIGRELEQLRIEFADAEKQHKSAEQGADKLGRKVQDRIVSELQEFDYSRFTKNRYSIKKVQGLLRDYRGEFPDQNAHAEALKRLGEGALVSVPEIPQSPRGSLDALDGMPLLLRETPTRVAIEALEGNPDAQAWVEDGLRLHGADDQCLFCGGEIEAQRRELLALHFDESWLELRGRARSLAAVAGDEVQALRSWLEALPSTAQLATPLRPAYGSAREEVEAAVARKVKALAAAAEVLGRKAADPSVVPAPPDLATLAESLPLAVASQAVAEHNDEVRRHDEVAEERKQVVLDHLVGANASAYRDLEATVTDCRDRRSASAEKIRLAERALDVVRQKQFTTKDMADTLTRDLARVYGKEHLSVVVTDDGKSYACRRGDEPATDLSDGERTTLSLLYFLRKLEDEQTPGADPSNRIVVVDDPSSSLDREALFATHQWLFDTLQEFGQYVVLTHDFSLLRLFLKSHKNAWGSSMKRLSQGDEDEDRFPKVAFLEMYATSVNGERRSQVGRLPQLLKNNTSEYAYLFAMVMAGVADADDHERLFLLPNAARRVIEVFASYKAPHRPDFLQQLQVLVETDSGEPFRDVYDFCNRYSHGEGSESLDVLDARAVHSHIRRCMEFLSAVDSEHFERMCAATGCDPTVLGGGRATAGS